MGNTFQGNGEHMNSDPLCQGCEHRYETPLTLRNCKICLKYLGIETDGWKHIWDAPDGTFKGKCENCGFVHFFVEGHDSQYRFCPQCGEQKVT